MMIYKEVKARSSWLVAFMIGVLAWAGCAPIYPSFAADIPVEETGLHDGASVYGLDVSDFASPFLNTDNYWVMATGDDSGEYDDVSFSVYSFYSLNAVDIQNQGSIELQSAGGEATGTEEATAAIEATGIATEGAVDNGEGVAIVAFGGNASVAAEADTEASAITTTSVTGIDSGGSVDNSGSLLVATLGGEALVTSDEGVFIEGTSDASAESLGIGAEGDVTNSAQIMTVAMAGTAGGPSTALSGAEAVGIETGGAMGNSSTLLVGAAGGEATTDGEFSDGTMAFAGAEAAGMLAEGEIVNSGDLEVIGLGGMASATNSVDDEAYDIADAGAEAVALISETAVTNSGDIIVQSTGGSAETNSPGGEFFFVPEALAESEAKGISSEGDATNSGAITVTATGGNATASEWAYASARAVGIEAEEVSNSGAISVTAEGGVSSSDDSYADAEAYAYGIHTRSSVTNSGAVTVLATGGDGTSESGENSYEYAEAYGIWSDGGGLNEGAITVTAAGGTTVDMGDSEVNVIAYGIRAGDVMTNSGAITVTATGGTAEGPDSLGDAEAFGIDATTDVSNSGAIVVTAHGGNATGEGSSADGMAAGIHIREGTAFVSNSADIIATATANEGYESLAYGIYFEGAGSLTNTGSLQAFGDTHAYEVAVISGTVTLVDSYNLTLDSDPAVGSLYVGDGAELALNDATLSVTMVDGTTQINTEYRIFDTDDGGTVSGAFGSLADPLNPDVVALYHDQATADSADDTVSLAYRPGASPQMEAAGLLLHAVNLAADQVGQRLTTGFLQTQLASRAPRLYAAAQTVVSDAGGQYGVAQTGSFFFTPYYASIDKDAAPAGYDADMVGFVTGFERQAGGNLCGLHLGFGHAGIDFTGNGYSDDQEDQELLSGGVHLMGSRGNWTWRGQVTGFYGWHDYEGLTGASLEQRESADYDSYGVRTTLLAGHLLQHRNQMLLPEVGVEYLWLHRDSFTTDADDPSWDMHSDSIDEHQVSALASLRWLTRLQAGDVEVTPSLAAGVRYLVTDDALDVHQSVAGSGPVTVRTEQDDVTGTVSASVRFRKEQLATELAYGGEFSDDSTMHSAWIRFRYLF
jgi:hypothetical protein